MYMEVIVPTKMADSFINDEYNKLTPTNDLIKYPKDAPTWFSPPKEFKEYKRGNQGSKYFIDTSSGHMYIYEIQL